MAVMKTWLYNSNNQQVAPNTTIDQIMMEDGISSFKEQYDADIAEAKSSGGAQGIDTSLTQPGAAADAKATGDKVNEIEEELSDRVKTYTKYLSTDLKDNDSYFSIDGFRVYESGLGVSGESGSGVSGESGFRVSGRLLTHNVVKISGYLGGFAGTKDLRPMAFVCFWDESYDLISAVPSKGTSMQYFETEVPENAYSFTVSSNESLGSGYYTLYYDYQNKINEIEKELSDGVVKTYTKHNSADLTEINSYWETNGNRVGKPGFRNSEFPAHNVVKISGYLGGYDGDFRSMAFVCFWDELHNLISYETSFEAKMEYFETEVPENAYYFTISSNQNLVGSGSGYYTIYYDYPTQINEIEKELSDRVVKTYTKYNGADLTEIDSYWDINGNRVSEWGLRSSEFPAHNVVKISGCLGGYEQNTGSPMALVCFWSESHEFISAVPSKGTSKMEYFETEVPENAYYFAISSNRRKIYTNYLRSEEYGYYFLHYDYENKINDIEEELNDRVVKTYTKYNSADLTEIDSYRDYYGNLLPKSGFLTSAELLIGKAIKISGYLGGYDGDTSPMALVCFWDESHEFISTVSSQSISMQYFETEVPENAYYFAVSSNENLGSGYYKLYYDGDYHQTQIEHNTVDIEYLKAEINNTKANIGVNWEEI